MSIELDKSQNDHENNNTTDILEPENDVINTGDDDFYLRKNNQQYGPYSEQEVIELLRGKQFTLNNPACVKGMNEWKSLGVIFREKPISYEVRTIINLEEWEREQIQISQAQTQYQGVGGWLLLFCIGLTILSPLRNLGSINQTLEAVKLVGGRFPGFVTIAYIEIVLIVAMVVFSIYAGISLWIIKPNAVTIAKFYLLFVVVVAIIDFVLVISIDMPEMAMREVTTAAVFGIVGSVLYSGVWFAYLNNSKRVEATYYNVV